jgi:hypothetical protein
MVNLPGGATSNLFPVPEIAMDSVLRTTPWGAYLVGGQGYGRVTYAGGVLGLDWVTLTDAVQSFFPGTFQGVDQDQVVVLARFDGTDNSLKQVTETRLLRLAATPGGNAQAAVLSTEKILDGVPRTAGAVRDPSQPDRVVGHCGGRLFSISRTIPVCYALERFSPAGMKAMELIEHICQVINAVAVPDPVGVLHIVSRALAEAPIAIQVDQAELLETRAWEHHYSVVRVSSAKDTAVYADAWGDPGGDVLEYSQHPLLWGQSGCDAVAQRLSAWFGKRRRYRQEKWVWYDPNAPAPWESLPPLATVQVNGGTDKWLVIGLEDDRVRGEARVKLVEVL